MRSALLLPLLTLALTTAAQVREPYALFDAKGKRLAYDKLVKQAAKTDVVLFGELHNNPVAHWLERALAEELAARGPLVLGAEMIEADDQAALDRYVRKEIDQAGLDTLARLWKNHPTDYAPLVDLARDKGLPFVATNVPRRYARAVSQGGFEALDTVPTEQRRWIAPLPIAYDPELPGYVRMMTMMGDHGSPNMPKAQALKDATMAHFILANLRPSARFLHFNGSYHSDFHEGIGWYLLRARPDLKVMTIATVTQDELSKLEAEHLGQADVIIVVDGSFPGSY